MSEFKQVYNRPEGITEFDIQTWQEEYKKFLATGAPPLDEARGLWKKLMPNYEMADPMEIWYAGSWFRREAEKFCDDEEKLTQAETALGQYQCFCTDVWGETQIRLEEFREGKLAEPGEELGKKLVNERLPLFTGKSMPKHERGAILKMFWEMNAKALDEKGVAISHAFIVTKDDEMICAALAMGGNPGAAYQIIKQFIDDGARELVFGLDRFTKEGQGTIFNDLLSVHYWDGIAWKFGIIEYQPPKNGEPRIVKTINWGNKFWNDSLASETAGFMGKIRTNLQDNPPYTGKEHEQIHFDKTMELFEAGRKKEASQWLRDEGFGECEIRRLCQTADLRLRAKQGTL